MIEIHPQRIWGRWQIGYALDLHTTSSTPIGENEYGHMQFETVRPPIAELLYQLKYRGDRSAIPQIADAAASFIKQRGMHFDVIVPAPPSSIRTLQPVISIAQAIGGILEVAVSQCISTTRPTAQLKNITDPDKRSEALDGLYAVDARQTKRRKLLLFDDLFRSGSTLNAISSLLTEDGEASRIEVLTITRTRSNQ